MKYPDAVSLLENGFEISGSPEFFEFNDQLAVNHKIALPLHSVSSLYYGQSEIEVRDKAGQLLGVLCLCKGKSIDLPKMTDMQIVCYFSEIHKDYYGQPYQFLLDYFVVDIDDFEDYTRGYLNTSFLWGGFVHAEHGTKQPYAQKISSIVAVPDLNLPTLYHTETGARGILQPFAFERFLKFYHLLELLFDYDTVEKIKRLADDLKGVGQIFSTYNKSEIEKLRYVIENRCTAYDEIASRLNGAFVSEEFVKKVKIIFFEFGKEGNPLKDNKEPLFDELIHRGGFTEDTARQVALAPNRKQYEKIILDTTVYWLYRIRCSIAHNRIGEYVMTMDDEKFVAEFAEPLLKEILIQAFTK